MALNAVHQQISAKDDYHIRRDTGESLRLTTQHHIVTERQGWLLHPRIESSISKFSNPHVLDVATGTGIWAIDLAHRIPHATVVGLDISDQQYPQQWTLPPNLQLGLLDLLEEIPEHLQGTFDVVHCRLLLAAGPNVDKSVWITRFSQLLKPNGWLQWDEIAWPVKKVVIPPKGGEGYTVEDFSDHPMCIALAEHLHMDVKNGWFTDFECVLERSGKFKYAKGLEIPIKPHLLKIETDSSVKVMTDCCNVLVEKKAISDEAVLLQLHEAIQAANTTREAGMYFSLNWHVGIAQTGSIAGRDRRSSAAGNRHPETKL